MLKSIDTASSQHQHSTHHLCQYFYSYMYAWGSINGKLTNTNLLTLSSLLQLLTLTAIKTSCGLSWWQSCWSYKESYAWLYYFLLFCWLTDRTLTTNFIALKPNCWDYFYPYICLGNLLPLQSDQNSKPLKHNCIANRLSIHNLRIGLCSWLELGYSKKKF